MQQKDVMFVLDDAGHRLALDALPQADEFTLASETDAIERAVTECGFVCMQSIHPVLLVKLSPAKVAPLAALEAFYQIRVSASECVVLVWPEHSWRRQRHEFLSSRAAALERMETIARIAGRRAAAELRARSLS